MINEAVYAPGCYGLFWTFRKDDEICSACPYATSCEVAHHKAADRVRQFYGVEAPKVRDHALAVKEQKLFASLGKSKEEVKAAMLEGRSPYNVKTTFIGAVCHLILVTRSSPRKALENALAQYKGYNADTASVYMRQALHILSYCGAVTVDGSMVHLSTGAQS
jgi:hypothetical protein